MDLLYTFTDIRYWSKVLHRTTPTPLGGLEARLARKFPAVITVLGNTSNFGKVGNTGKYEIIGLFWLRYSA